jgi:hypothetical protein
MFKLWFRSRLGGMEQALSSQATNIEQVGISRTDCDLKNPLLES